MQQSRHLGARSLFLRFSLPATSQLVPTREGRGHVRDEATGWAALDGERTVAWTHRLLGHGVTFRPWRAALSPGTALAPAPSPLVQTLPPLTRWLASAVPANPGVILVRPSLAGMSERSGRFRMPIPPIVPDFRLPLPSVPRHGGIRAGGGMSAYMSAYGRHRRRGGRPTSASAVPSKRLQARPGAGWSGRRDSNPRPIAWEAIALPLRHSRVVMSAVYPTPACASSHLQWPLAREGEKSCQDRLSDPPRVYWPRSGHGTLPVNNR